MLIALLSFALAGPDLDSRIAEVVPRAAEEKWLTSTPWRMNLTQARIDAQETGKPILMWVMNGHPMGCT